MRPHLSLILPLILKENILIGAPSPLLIILNILKNA